MNRRQEEMLYALTPCEHRGVWFKREDYFAPFGRGGVNGGKLRQCFRLIGRALDRGATLTVSAASLHSPQLSAAATVSAFYGMRCLLVAGGKPETRGRHENVRIAEAYGAQFAHVDPAYNPVLQARARQLVAEDPSAYLLPYGIAVPETATIEEKRAFHDLGAAQVVNLPESIETLCMATGSAHSTASVLYGLRSHPNAAPALKRVVLVAVGPDRMGYLQERLSELPGGQRELSLRRVGEPPLGRGLDVELDSRLVASKTFSYQKTEKASYAGVEFHERYEAKAWNFLRQWRHQLLGENTLFWIIGAEPRLEAMQ